MIDVASFLIGMMFGGVGTFLLIAYAMTPPPHEETPNEEIEKELLEDQQKKG